MDLEDWCLWYKRRGAGRLRRLFKRLWDPIGIDGIPQARDEYDSHLGLIADSLRLERSLEGIADQLHAIRTTSMGLDERRNADVRFARSLKDWYAKEIANR